MMQLKNALNDAIKKCNIFYLKCRTMSGILNMSFSHFLL